MGLQIEKFGFTRRGVNLMGGVAFGFVRGEYKSRCRGVCWTRRMKRKAGVEQGQYIIFTSQRRSVSGTGGILP
jgi:hypothetical protein